MSDLFAQNWLKRKKTDPIINAIYTGIPMVRYDYGVYGPNWNHTDIVEYEFQRGTVTETEAEAEQNDAYTNLTPRVGRIRRGKAEKWIDSSDYWKNMGPNSFYNLRLTNTFYNPLFERIKK